MLQFTITGTSQRASAYTYHPCRLAADLPSPRQFSISQLNSKMAQLKGKDYRYLLNGHDIRLVVDPSACKHLLCDACGDLCFDGVEDSQGTLFCLVKLPTLSVSYVQLPNPLPHDTLPSTITLQQNKKWNKHSTPSLPHKSQHNNTKKGTHAAHTQLPVGTPKQKKNTPTLLTKRCLQLKDPSSKPNKVEFIRRSVLKVVIICPRQFMALENSELAKPHPLFVDGTFFKKKTKREKHRLSIINLSNCDWKGPISALDV